MTRVVVVRLACGCRLERRRGRLRRTFYCRSCWTLRREELRRAVVEAR